MGSDEMQVRLRMLLGALDDDNLREHAAEGLRHLVSYEALTAVSTGSDAAEGKSRGRSFEMLHRLVKELIESATSMPQSSLLPTNHEGAEGGDSNGYRKRLESLKLISLAIEAHRLPAILPMMSSLLFRLADACSSPAGGAAPVSNEIAGCVGWVTRAVIEHHTMYDWTPVSVGSEPRVLPHRRSDAPWLSQLILHPFIASVAQARGNKPTLFSASRCLYVSLNEFLLKLEACRDAAQDCIVYVAHIMHSGGDDMLAGGAVFLPLQRAVEIVGIGSLRKHDVRVMVEGALRVIATATRAGNNDWGATVLAIQMLFVLAATTWSEEEARLAQMQKDQSTVPQAGPVAAIEELYALKLLILAALQEAKHDSVSNVRRIASETITEFKTVERIRLRVHASMLASTHKERLLKLGDSNDTSGARVHQEEEDVQIGTDEETQQQTTLKKAVTRTLPATDSNGAERALGNGTHVPTIPGTSRRRAGHRGADDETGVSRQARRMAELSRPRSVKSKTEITASNRTRTSPSTPISSRAKVGRPKSAGPMARTASANRFSKSTSTSSTAAAKDAPSVATARRMPRTTKRDVPSAKTTPKQQILPQFVANAPLATEDDDGAIGVSIFVPGSKMPITDFSGGFDEKEEAMRRRWTTANEREEHGSGHARSNGRGMPSPASHYEDSWIVNQTFEDGGDQTHNQKKKTSSENGGGGTTTDIRYPAETPRKTAFFDAYMTMASEQATPMPVHREASEEEEKEEAAQEEEDGAGRDITHSVERQDTKRDADDDSIPVPPSSSSPKEVVEFGKYGIDMDAHLSHVSDPSQRRAILTLASGHITKMQTSYARRAKARIDSLKEQYDVSVAKLDDALRRDIDETRRATATAIQQDAKKFAVQLLPSLLELLGTM